MFEIRKILSAILLIMVGCSGCGTLRNSVSNKLYVSPVVLQNMFEIQREYSIETARCLTGYVDEAKRINITGIQPVWIKEQDSVHVNFTKCASEMTIGFYHNHVQGPNEETACWFSETDVNTVNNFSPLEIGVVTCSDRNLIWYFKNDEISYFYSFTDERYDELSKYEVENSN